MAHASPLGSTYTWYRITAQRLPFGTQVYEQGPVLFIDAHELTIKVCSQLFFFVEQVSGIKADAYSIVQLPGEVHIQATCGLVPD